MNEPAPFAPAPDAAQQPAPMAPPAPPAPPAPAGFAMPADPAAALDVTAPLQMQPPGVPPAPPAPEFAQQQAAMQQQAQQQAAMQQQAGAPVEQIMPQAMSFTEMAAAPHAAPQHHEEHPMSLAMPQQAAHGAPAHAMPAGFDDPALQGHIGGVAAVSPEDLADRAGFAPAAAPAGDFPEWASPGWALVLAMFALTWQLVSFYASEILPSLKASGQLLANFDEIVSNAPVIGSNIGAFVGMGLGAAALFLMYMGFRAGMREPVLQGAIAVLAGLALATTVLLPMFTA